MRPYPPLGPRLDLCSPSAKWVVAEPDLSVPLLQADLGVKQLHFVPQQQGPSGGHGWWLRVIDRSGAEFDDPATEPDNVEIDNHVGAEHDSGTAASD